jgi:hypothetical protein
MGAERRGRLICWFVSASNQAMVWEETRGQVRTGRQVVSDTEAAGVRTGESRLIRVRPGWTGSPWRTLTKI